MMKNVVFYLLVIVLIAGCSPRNSSTSEDEYSVGSQNEYNLVWQDEFDYAGLPDSSKWSYDTAGNVAGWGNNEEQFYTVARLKNSSVKDGLLHITAIKEDFGGKKYTSARLISKADWKHGKIEVNAKLPVGRGTWSAIWMMPGGWLFHDGNWPDIGEIDIMEHVGHERGIIHASAHSKDYQWQKGTQKTGVISVPQATEIFHSYILEWEPDVIKAYLDDSLYFEYKNEGLGEAKWPYEKPFYLILNLAIGGAWGAMNGIDENAFPQTMEVNFVRIYQKD